MKLDHTTYSTFDRCEQEGVWRHQRHLVGTGVEASAHFGQVLHVGVRALYSGNSVGAAQALMRQEWTKGMEAQAVASVLVDGPRHCVVCGGWGGGDTLPPARSVARRASVNTCTCATPDFAPTFDANKLHLSLWRAYKTLDIYAVEWGLCNAYGEALKPANFDVVWNEGYAESAEECGLPDRAVRRDGLVWAMDLKTTGMYITQDWQRSFEHSQQVAIQLDILEHTLGEPVAGFWLDAVHIRRDGVPRKDDLSRYGPVVYSQALRAELREQRRRKAERVAELLDHPERALKSPGACVRYNQLCPYFDLCKAEPGDREALLQIGMGKGNFREEEWKPSAR